MLVVKMLVSYCSLILNSGLAFVFVGVFALEDPVVQSFTIPDLVRLGVAIQKDTRPTS